MDGLGSRFDLQGTFVGDLDSDPICEVSLANAAGVTFYINAASASNAVDLNFTQDDGGGNDKAIVLPPTTRVFTKRHGSTVPGTWTEMATVPGDLLTGEIDNVFTSGNGGIVAVYVPASALDVDGGYYQAACQAVASGARQGGVTAIVEPLVQRTPTNMPSLTA